MDKRQRAVLVGVILRSSFARLFHIGWKEVGAEQDLVGRKINHYHTSKHAHMLTPRQTWADRFLTLTPPWETALTGGSLASAWYELMNVIVKHVGGENLVDLARHSWLVKSKRRSTWLRRPGFFLTQSGNERKEQSWRTSPNTDSRVRVDKRRPSWLSLTGRKPAKAVLGKLEEIATADRNELPQLYADTMAEIEKRRVANTKRPKVALQKFKKEMELLDQAHSRRLKVLKWEEQWAETNCDPTIQVVLLALSGSLYTGLPRRKKHRKRWLVPALGGFGLEVGEDVVSSLHSLSGGRFFVWLSGLFRSD